MREKSSAARGFPPQGAPKGGRLHREDHQILLPREMPPRRCGQLVAGGEMNESILSIHS